MELEKFPTSENAIKMLEMVTSGWYDKSYVGKWIYQVMGAEWDSIQTVMDELPYQFFVSTATWGLSWHEMKYGLFIRDDLPYDERRKLIYNRKKSRVPMTPYNMEQILNRTLSINSEVSDIHDRGDTGYIPNHPNIFLVRVIDKKNADEFDRVGISKQIDKLKQSHTVYTLEHCQEDDKHTALYIGAMNDFRIKMEIPSRPVMKNADKHTALYIGAMNDFRIKMEIQLKKHEGKVI